jgi:hypothetical protein
MPRAKKDSRVLNINLATSTANKLDQFCQENGITKTSAVEQLLDQYLDEYFQKPEDERKLI